MPLSCENLLSSKQRLRNCVSLAVFGAAFVGCGNGSVPTYPVSGSVKYQDGKPLSGGTVSFRSLDNPTHLTARGEIEEDGTFALSTFEEGDGAVVGRQQVIVTPPFAHPPRGGGWEAPPPTPKVNRRFTSYETSGLEFDVTNNASQNRFEIVVTQPD